MLGVGVALLVIGWLLLTTWEIGASHCGAPLDNPGWRTGERCHGQVSRQEAIGVALIANGLAVSVVAVTLGARAWSVRFADRGRDQMIRRHESGER
jgi:hypothetical protein